MKWHCKAVAVGLSLWAHVASGQAVSPLASIGMKNIDAMAVLPVQGFHLVESDGHLVLMSTNARYVVINPKLQDLWNQKELHSVKDMQESNRIPIDRLRLTADQLGGVVVGQDTKKHTTVFLDPASKESAKVLTAIRQLAQEQRVDVVFVPARDATMSTSLALTCDHEAALAYVKTGALPASPRKDCSNELLMRARASVFLLNIAGLPFTVAPNGTPMLGFDEKYLPFIAKNME